MSENHSAKFAFYYLLSLAALIFMAISFGMIVFGIIDVSIIDPLLASNRINTYSNFKFALSALLISAPIYFFTLNLIKKGIKKKELDLSSPIRRWLTYLIILVSAMIMLGVFIGTFNGFLSGELTLRFILKALSLLIISGLTFGYYFCDIRSGESSGRNKWNKFFLLSSLVLVLAAFISAWFYIDSPKEARDKRMDQKLVNEIEILEQNVNYYYEENNQIPDTLTDFIDSQERIAYLNDLGVEYKKSGEDDFELCATFKRASQDDARNNIYLVGPRNKLHNSGYDCFNGYLWQKEVQNK